MKKSGNGFLRAYFGSLLLLGILSIVIGAAYQTIVEARSVEEGGEVFLDGNNKKMGTMKGEKVFNKNNKLIGYVKSSGTYSASNKKIANSKMPGLLFCGEK